MPERWLSVHEIAALIEKAGVATFDAQCIPTDAVMLELGGYKAFLAKRRELIAVRLNAFLGTATALAVQHS